jgi:hypothetical protein
MARWSAVFLLVFAVAGSAHAGQSSKQPNWPTLRDQLAVDNIAPNSALGRLVAANQDFSILRPEEAKDLIRVPLWLRVLWRKSHPEMAYPADDPTGGYPFVLKEVNEWMVSHPDLVPGPGRGESAEEMEKEGEIRSATETLEQRISGAQTAPRSESDIRINFWDPSKIIGASNNISGTGVQAQFFSTNGGTTWGQSTLSLQPGDAFHSDPTVDWTSDGTAWSTTIGINSGGNVLHMRAYKSTDNGATWTFDNTFSAAQTSTDKQIMWTDHSNSSPFKDNIYVIWHNGTPAFMNRRTGPAGSWQTPIQVSGAESTGTAIGDDVKTNAFGDVFGFWPTTTNRKIFVVKSTNGGVSYGTPIQIGSTFDSFDIGVPSFSSRRALIYISGGAYRTATKDLVYATWTDLTGAAGCTAAGNEPGTNVASTCKTRIWFSRSTDGGATWSPAVMLNNQASLNDQYNQWFAVDETTGELAVMYYDTVGDAGRKKSDVWYQSSFNDGVTWSAPFKVTSAQTDETTGGQDNGNQYGDYNGLSGYAGVFFPSWTERRGGAREEIWSARVLDPSCTFTGAPTIGTATATAPNQVQVTWTDGAPSSTAFNVYRATGTCAAHGSFAQVASSVAGSPYTDNTVSGTITYAYQVTGLDVTGSCESAPSACVEVTATGACTLPPSFAGLASVTNQAAATCGLDLAWSAATPACAGPVTYKVYRSTSSGFVPSPAELIATGVTGTAYTDASPLVSGTTYYYVVRSVDSSNGMADNNTVQKSAAPTGPIANGTLTETFEGTGFDNPGWTHSALSGAVDWVWSTTQAQTPTHSWFSADQTTVSERVLVTPNFVPQAGTTLSFWHTFAFESATSCFDAGTLETSTDSGATWNVLPDANFTAGGFNGTVSSSFSNPLGGKRAWCNGTIGAMTQVTANLGSFNGAAGMKLRWHEGDDSSAAATGWFVDSVTIANAGTASTCSPSGGPAVVSYFTVVPCRVIDTRDPDGPLAGPALQPSSQRTFTVGGTCGIPVGAKAISINIGVTQPANEGDLRLFPANVAAPVVSVINFGPGQTRSNNAVLPLDAAGAFKVQTDSLGTVHMFLDVNGYFQ